MNRITRMLVPTDFSETSDVALAYAKTLAEAVGASLHLVHVFEDPYLASGYAPEIYAPLPEGVRDAALRSVERLITERMTLEDRPRFRGTIEVVTGPTAREIVKYAADHDIDLVVIGTHRRSGVAHLLLGSVAERVVRTAPGPVLTVRHAGASNKRAAA